MKSLMNILLKSLISLTFCLGFTANAQDVEVIKNAPTDVKWEIQPNIIVDNDELGGYDRLVKIKFKAYENGYVQYAAVIESSGLPELDDYALNEYRKQVKFYPLIINGKPHSMHTTMYYRFSRFLNTTD